MGAQALVPAPFKVGPGGGMVGLVCGENTNKVPSRIRGTTSGLVLLQIPRFRFLDRRHAIGVHALGLCVVKYFGYEAVSTVPCW